MKEVFIWARVCLDIVREYLYFLKPFVHKNKQTIWTVAKFSKENRKSKIYKKNTSIHRKQYKLQIDQTCFGITPFSMVKQK